MQQWNKGYPLDKVREGDYVVLFLDPRRKWLLKAIGKKEFHTHKGLIKLAEVVGKSYGEKVKTSLDFDFWILKPTTYDFIMSAKRLTQIVYPKDAGIILLRLGIGPGKKVIEAGTGSGAMTLALANAVKPRGHIYSYELRPEFIEVAKRNLEKANVAKHATIKNLDARLGFEEEKVDAVFVDLGEPWEIVPHAYKSLKGGSSIGSFSPTMNQVEKTVTALNRNNFVDISSIECLVREMRVEEGKTRPLTTMIGHTGYITFARKILRQNES